jgi:hypothetical protein
MAEVHKFPDSLFMQRLDQLVTLIAIQLNISRKAVIRAIESHQPSGYPRYAMHLFNHSSLHDGLLSTECNDIVLRSIFVGVLRHISDRLAGLLIGVNVAGLELHMCGIIGENLAITRQHKNGNLLGSVALLSRDEGCNRCVVARRTTSPVPIVHQFGHQEVPPVMVVVAHTGHLLAVTRDRDGCLDIALRH